LGSEWAFLLTSAAYAAGSFLALRLIEVSELADLFCIPTGVTLASRLPMNLWWVVLLAPAGAEASTDLLAGIPATRSRGL
jgi:hypothetical protein